MSISLRMCVTIFELPSKISSSVECGPGFSGSDSNLTARYEFHFKIRLIVHFWTVISTFYIIKRCNDLTMITKVSRQISEYGQCFKLVYICSLSSKNCNCVILPNFFLIFSQPVFLYVYLFVWHVWLSICLNLFRFFLCILHGTYIRW